MADSTQKIPVQLWVLINTSVLLSEVQRGKVICPRKHSLKTMKSGEWTPGPYLLLPSKFYRDGCVVLGESHSCRLICLSTWSRVGGTVWG